jgi:hypothetical protein
MEERLYAKGPVSLSIYDAVLDFSPPSVLKGPVERNVKAYILVNHQLEGCAPPAIVEIVQSAVASM